MNSLFLHAPALAQDIVLSFYTGVGEEHIFSHFSVNIIWADLECHAYLASLPDVKNHFAAYRQNCADISVSDLKFTINHFDQLHCLVTGEYLLRRSRLLRQGKCSIGFAAEKGILRACFVHLCAEPPLSPAHERYRLALESIADEIIEYDIENDSLLRLGPPSSPDPHSIPCYSNAVKTDRRIHPEDTDRLLDTLCGKGRRTADVRLASGAGWRWIRLSVSVVRDGSGRPVRTVGSRKDITQEKQEYDRLIGRAYRDPLTQLYNQAALSSFIDKALSRAEGSAALLVIDVDNFKTVNDTLGHLAGDNVLIQLANVMRACIPKGGISSRIGGDEFVVFLPHAGHREAVQLASLLVHSGVHAPGFPGKITLSIGIALTQPGAPDCYTSVFSRADKALYNAKARGKNRYCFSAP